MKNDETTLIAGVMKGLYIPKSSAGAQPTRPGQLSVVTGVLMVAVDNGSGGLSWEQAVDPRDPDYEFTTHTFIPAGAIGRIGPTIAQLSAAYGSAPFMGSDDLFRVENGLQIWKVPANGIYEFVLKGAARAASASLPAQLTVRLAMLLGDYVTMAVGQQAAGDWGGNGGSFVRSVNRGLIAVAGGAGGMAGSLSRSPVLTVYDESNAPSGNAGNNVRSSTVDGKFSTGHGGAGATGDGVQDAANPGTPAASFANGAVGGIVTGMPHTGGFGCGAAGMSGYQTRGVGGGGGYTGGNGSASNGSSGGDSGGFGGTNFCTNIDIVSKIAPSNGTRTDGFVRITKVG